MRRAPPHLFWALIACGNVQPIPGATGVLEDDAVAQAAAWQAPAGWVDGGVMACDAAREPSWVEQGRRLGQPLYTDTFIVEQSAVVLGDGDRFVQVEGLGVAVERTLDGEARAIPAPWPITRVAAMDLREDGQRDLILLGQGLQVVWDADSPNERIELLAQGEPFSVFRAAVPGDLDGDGDLDLFALVAGGETSGHSEGLLWRNEDGDLIGPEPVWDRADPRWGNPFSVRMMDFTGDAAPDLYFCNDFGPEQGGNWLLANDGRGGFTPEAAPGLDLATYCMGTSVGDANADGALDLYLGAIESHFLLEKAGSGYVEAEAAARLPGFLPHQMVWGSQMIDLDNDGAVDILAATSDFTVPKAEAFPLWAMMGQGDGTFVESGAALGLPQAGYTRALVARDLNEDGLPDLFVTGFDATPRLYLSEGCTDGSFVVVEAPEGSVVEVEADGQVFAALVTGRPGFSASMRPEAHIGLGAVEVIDRLTLRPSWGPPVVLEGPMAPRRRLRWDP